MKVVIIEDESLVAKDLQKQLQKIEPGIEITAVLDSVQGAQRYFESHAAPDLIFSDIQLSDGVSFDIFRDSLPDFPIIFTTAYDEYAIAAFKLNSIDYLLKPIDEEDLRKAIAKFKKYQISASTSDYSLQFSALLRDLKAGTEKKYKTRFTGHWGKAVVAVQEDQVAYFTKDALIFLHTLDSRQIVTDYHSLEELESLIDPRKFFRANRQYIIHLNAIDNIKPHFTGKLFVYLREPLQTEITVSREKATEFRKWFEGI